MFYIPEAINLPEIEKAHPPFTGYSREDSKHILSSIIEVYSKGFFNKKNFPEGFVPLNAENMKNNGVRKFRDHINYLINAGVIESDGRYKIGSKSRGYKIGKNYNSPIKTIKPEARRFKDKPSGTVEAHELSKYFSNLLKIKEPEANDYLIKRYQEEKRTKKHELSLLRLNSGLMSVDKINRGDFHFGMDNTVGRVHTSVSCLQKHLRSQFLTYDGKTLAYIDLVNSQPFLSSLLLDPSFWDENYTIDNKITFGKNYISHQLEKDISSPLMFRKTSNLFENENTQLYLSLVKSGMFYEEFESIIKTHTPEAFDGCSTEEESRSVVKKTMFQVLYSDNRFIGQPEAALKRAFRHAYPSVYEIFSTIKQHNKSALALILQRIESELFINRIAMGLLNHAPTIQTLFTIHDSLGVMPGDVELVKNVAINEIKNSTGLLPKFKIEYKQNLVEHAA